MLGFEQFQQRGHALAADDQLGHDHADREVGQQRQCLVLRLGPQHAVRVADHLAHDLEHFLVVVDDQHGLGFRRQAGRRDEAAGLGQQRRRRCMGAGVEQRDRDVRGLLHRVFQVLRVPGLLDEAEDLALVDRGDDRLDGATGSDRLDAVYMVLSAAARTDNHSVGAEEWLRDNHHVVQDQVREVRQHLPKKYYLELPKLADGPFSGYPRVYLLARELIEHTAGRIDLDAVDSAVRLLKDARRDERSEISGRLTKLESLLDEALSSGTVAVIPGFQGVSEEGRVATLGRGGSDLTAVVLATGLGAVRCELVKDVPGYFTADPNLDPGALPIPALDYGTALSMADEGCELVQRQGLPRGRAAQRRQGGPGERQVHRLARPARERRLALSVPHHAARARPRPAG